MPSLCPCTAWSASKWARAAEILRHYGAPWDPVDVDLFARMLRDVLLPKIFDGAASNAGECAGIWVKSFYARILAAHPSLAISPGTGNWELSMIEGALELGQRLLAFNAHRLILCACLQALR